MAQYTYSGTKTVLKTTINLHYFYYTEKHEELLIWFFETGFLV